MAKYLKNLQAVLPLQLYAMQTLETFLHRYHISHAELSKLAGKHRTLVTKALQGERSGRQQLDAMLRLVCHQVEKLPAGACLPPSFCSPAPEWLEQEQLKATTLNQRLTALLNVVEKLHRQVRFWYYISQYANEFTCGHEWAQRHYEEKLFKLKRTWELQCLPLLLRLRETEARIDLLQGNARQISFMALLKNEL